MTFQTVISSSSASSVNLGMLGANITDVANTVHVVIPCYNEEKRLDPAAFFKALEEQSNLQFVFVNDGSRDGTLELLEKMHRMMPNRIEVLTLVKNSGKAEAVRRGLLHCVLTGATVVGYWDADLATPLELIEDFHRVMKRHTQIEVVFGSRRQMLGHAINRTFTRRMVSRACATLARVAVRLPIGDTQCGAKMLRVTPALREAVSTPFTAGWLFDVELFTRISALTENRNRAFYEQPLSIWTEIAGSKVSGSAIVRAGFSMIRLIAESRLGVQAKVALNDKVSELKVVCALRGATI